MKTVPVNRTERKEYLQSIGQWERFKTRREELKAGGMDKDAAETQALAEIEAAQQAEDADPKYVTATGEYAADLRSLRKALEWERAGAPEDLEIISDNWATCSEEQAVLWALQYAGQVEIYPSMAPSKQAWELRLNLQKLLLGQLVSDAL